jgi:integrase/recombinase XerD
MATYQYVREPLRAEEADRLSHACDSPQEKLIVWTLLDTGLRVSELCSLTPQHILWQQKSVRVSGKGGRSYVKARTNSFRALLCHS